MNDLKEFLSTPKLKGKNVSIDVLHLGGRGVYISCSSSYYTNEIFHYFSNSRLTYRGVLNFHPTAKHL